MTLHLTAGLRMARTSARNGCTPAAGELRVRHALLRNDVNACSQSPSSTDPLVAETGAPKLYTELASWWPLLSSPAEYAEEAALYRRILVGAGERPPRTPLELGSGGGSQASTRVRR